MTTHYLPLDPELSPAWPSDVVDIAPLRDGSQKARMHRRLCDALTLEIRKSCTGRVVCQQLTRPAIVRPTNLELKPVTVSAAVCCRNTTRL